MFRTDATPAPPLVRVQIDGVWHETTAGRMLAAVLLEAGVLVFRSSPSGQPRAAYCLMGVCHDCLVSVDGVGSCQSCQVAVSDGMQVQTGAPPVAPDSG